LKLRLLVISQTETDKMSQSLLLLSKLVNLLSLLRRLSDRLFLAVILAKD
jgi:hypothetical protein